MWRRINNILKRRNTAPLRSISSAAHSRVYLAVADITFHFTRDWLRWMRRARWSGKKVTIDNWLENLKIDLLFVVVMRESWSPTSMKLLVWDLDNFTYPPLLAGQTSKVCQNPPSQHWWDGSSGLLMMDRWSANCLQMRKVCECGRLRKTWKNIQLCAIESDTWLKHSKKSLVRWHILSTIVPVDGSLDHLDSKGWQSCADCGVRRRQLTYWRLANECQRQQALMQFRDPRYQWHSGQILSNIHFIWNFPPQLICDGLACAQISSDFKDTHARYQRNKNLI